MRETQSVKSSCDSRNVGIREDLGRNNAIDKFTSQFLAGVLHYGLLGYDAV
jgi:hypothetical protein